MDNTLSFTKPLLETPFHKRTFEACYNNDWVSLGLDIKSQESIQIQN